MILSSVKKVTQHMNGQQVKYIRLTECVYFGLRMVIWLFSLLFVYTYVYLWQGEKQKRKPEKSMFYQLQWTRIPLKVVAGQWNPCSLFLRLYISKKFLKINFYSWEKTRTAKKKSTKPLRNNAHSATERFGFFCFFFSHKCVFPVIPNVQNIFLTDCLSTCFCHLTFI